MKKSILNLSTVPIIIVMLIVNCLLPKISSAQFTKLHDFTGYDGDFASGNLISDGTFLYGMTLYGGCCNSGNIFKINKSGTVIDTLKSFNSTNGVYPYGSGAYPYGSLTLVDTVLYGMTNLGGADNFGVIFSINKDGTHYQILKSFYFATTGHEPLGSLIYDGTYLYGMTSEGSGSGLTDYGVIFRIKPDGSHYKNLHDFDDTHGSTPLGSLILIDTTLYGIANTGGTNSYGVIFKINRGGSLYTVLNNFTDTANGPASGGSLISDGTYIYGMTEGTDANKHGTIFKMNLATTSLSVLRNYGWTSESIASGSHSLIFDGASTTLFGMEQMGGAKNEGMIFKINPDGTKYADLFDFDSINGRFIGGTLFNDGTYLYGMTQSGGAHNYGTVFKLKYCINPLTISDQPTYNGPTYSTNIYSDITIGTNNTLLITASKSQIFKYSYSTVLNGPFSSGTVGLTLSITPTPCP